jgi:hypothetical protein
MTTGNNNISYSHCSFLNNYIHTGSAA